MIVFGLILILLGVAVGGFGVWVALQNAAAQSSVSAFNNTIYIGPMTLLLVGAATVLLVQLGLWLITASTRRKVRAGKERRDLVKQQKQQEKDLADTRSRLGKDPEPTHPRPSSTGTQSRTSTGTAKETSTGTTSKPGSAAPSDPKGGASASTPTTSRPVDPGKDTGPSA